MDFEEFCQVVSDLTHVPLNKISEKSSFRDDLRIDSLQMVNLLVQLSEKLEVGFEQLIGSDNISSIGGLYQTFMMGAE